jgi:hypothetical protein
MTNCEKPASPHLQPDVKPDGLEHFNIENIYPDKMLWRCEAKCSNAREIVAGGLRPPLSDNLKRKML